MTALNNDNAKCEGEEECSHTKIYSGEYYATLPPRWHWICERCGATGVDQADKIEKLELQLFAETMIKFHGEGPLTSSGAPFWRYVLEELV